MSLRLRSGQPSGPGQASSHPPRFAEWLLATLIRDSEWRDSIVGDLREEFARLHAAHGQRAAWRWHWRQALAIGGCRLASRLGAPRLPRGSWLSAAEVETRTAWHVGLTRDVRHAWRALLRRPATSVVIVLTLALTLGVNSTIFALLDSLVLRPFRFPGVDRLAVIMSTSPQDPTRCASGLPRLAHRSADVEISLRCRMVGRKPFGHRDARTPISPSSISNRWTITWPIAHRV